MKRLWLLILIFVLCIVVFYGCSKTNAYNSTNVISTSTPNNPMPNATPVTIDPIKQWMTDNKVYIKAKEVEFDMKNKLDTPFIIDGTAELDDYYNYGYTNDKNYFCINVTPEDGSYSHSWYIYCDRQSYKELYNELLSKNSTYVIIKAIINKNDYEDNQGNMASAELISWN